MISRRDWLKVAAGAGAAFMVKGCSPSDGGDAALAAVPAEGPAGATGVREILTRAIPSSGEQIPVIGLGGVGMAALLGAVAAGAEQIVAVDIARDKLNIALSLGATDAVLATEPDAVRAGAAGALGRGRTRLTAFRSTEKAPGTSLNTRSMPERPRIITPSCSMRST